MDLADALQIRPGVTALIGGVLALIIIPRLAKVKKES